MSSTEAEIIAASQAETPMEDDEKPMDDETHMEDGNEPPPPERLSPATADDLADFATALLAAPNLDVNAVGRLGRVHESAKNADLNAPYKGLVPYKGRCGAEGKFLFIFFVCAIVLTSCFLKQEPRCS